MNQQQCIDVIKKAISEHSSTDIDEIKEESLLANDLNLDSLDIVEIIMEVEDELDVEIADDNFSNYKTVKELTDYIIKDIT